MNLKEFLDTAPKDATHYYLFTSKYRCDGKFYKKENNIWMAWQRFGQGWLKSTHKYKWPKLISISKKKMLELY